jgi:hypothetical protein
MVSEKHQQYTPRPTNSSTPVSSTTVTNYNQNRDPRSYRQQQQQQQQHQSRRQSYLTSPSTHTTTTTTTAAVVHQQGQNQQKKQDLSIFRVPITPPPTTVVASTGSQAQTNASVLDISFADSNQYSTLVTPETLAAKYFEPDTSTTTAAAGTTDELPIYIPTPIFRPVTIHSLLIPTPSSVRNTIPNFNFYNMAEPKVAHLNYTKYGGDVFDDMPATETECGVRAVILTDVDKCIEHVADDIKAVIPEGEFLRDKDALRRHEIVFLQVSPPGGVFEKLDKDSKRIVMTLGAYYRLLKFFYTDYQECLENINMYRNQYETNAGVRCRAHSSTTHGGPGGGYSMYILDSHPQHFDLQVVCILEESNKVAVYLYYNFKDSVHLELPIAPMLKLASQVDKLKGLLQFYDEFQQRKKRSESLSTVAQSRM